MASDGNWPLQNTTEICSRLASGVTIRGFLWFCFFFIFFSLADFSFCLGRWFITIKGMAFTYHIWGLGFVFWVWVSGFRLLFGRWIWYVLAGNGGAAGC